MRKTKIVCTVGPACDNKETLLQMIDAGMNVVWNGESWDPMAPMITMTGITNEEIDALFA